MKTTWRWRRRRELSERFHGLPGVARRLTGTACGSPGPGLGLTCDVRRGHRHGVCEDRAWIGGYK